MTTKLAIDDQLLDQAVRLGRHRTKCEAVNEALRSYIALCLRRESVRFFGTFDFDPRFDYKQARRVR